MTALLTRRHAEAVTLFGAHRVPEDVAREAECWNITEDEALALESTYRQDQARRRCGEHVQERLNEIAEDRATPVVLLVGVGSALTIAAILIYALVTI